MTFALPGPRSGSPATVPTPRAHPQRWRMHRAGIVNVWFYLDQRFDLSGGRLILRGTNGSGKSRALEMMLPFVLDADRRRMDATGSGKVRLEDLMRAGGEEQPNRLGYVWLELIRPGEGHTPAAAPQYLTVGALIRFSRSTSEAKAWYFATPLRVDHELVLVDSARTPLSREGLVEAVGADRVTDKPETHRERIRSEVFGLQGRQGRERYIGLLQLLHTLRAPDVGNRIDEGRLPQILSDALPPLPEASLATAGEELDGLEETRQALERLESAYGHIADFLRVYTRYATGVLASRAKQTLRAAENARTLEGAATRERDAHEHLAQERAETAARVEELDDLKRELEATATGIRQSREYRAVRELSERTTTVQALASAADNALDAAYSARRQEQATVDSCDQATEDVQEQGNAITTLLTRVSAHLNRAALSAALPTHLTITTHRPAALAEPVRTIRTSDPEPVQRPVPLVLSPAAEEAAAAAQQLSSTADTVRAAAAARQQQADARHTDARRLAAALQNVQRAEDRAEEAAATARSTEERAQDKAGERDEAAEDLALQWRSWTTSAVTISLLGTVDWSATAAAPAFHGGERLSEASSEDLAAMDAAASAAATPPRQEHARAMAELDARQRQAAETADALTEEARALHNAEDVPPPAPHWVSSPPPGSVELWRVLEFRPGLSGADRAGLEAALLAAGILTARITPEGDLEAADGNLLLRPSGPAVLHSVRAVLHPSQPCPVPAARVEAVLERIALDSSAHATWISRDGSWGNGPLHGRHRLSTARYIGAVARAAARAARLEQIQAQLQELAQAAEERAQARDRLATVLTDLEAHVLTAPRSTALASLRHQAAQAAVDAADARRQARELHEQAATLRREWAVDDRQHSQTCAALGLPADSAALATVSEAAATAESGCRELQQAAATVTGRIQRYQARLDQAVQETARRHAAEDKAAVACATWSAQAAELAALRETLGSTPQQITDALEQADRALSHATSDHKTASRVLTDLTAKEAAAGITSRHAAEQAAQARQDLASSAAQLRHRTTHPALAHAFSSPAPALTDLPADPSPEQAVVLARTVTAALNDSAHTADVTALLRAQSLLERHTSGSYDVQDTVEDDLHIVELIDATGRRHIAQAAAELKDRRDRGRLALTQRERDAFHRFVLGGMAGELRDRIHEADRLIKAMNQSLETISTSHGIGVRVRWVLAESAQSATARLKELLARDPRVLREEETDELIVLLRSRVDQAHANEPDAGYATHLRTALDYRTWHTVKVIIIGPAPGQERSISRRAKLSQGETRFVSYVTLFAAADAYLSGLPDTDRALRLILLDDAFAKVDQPTIGEFMNLLVRLDLDFVMTGHALWGFFPGVPALDTYEVRRAEGTPAITTHVHWDGHTRHLRTAS
ncbi:TIGR02680 family protein [Actinacidiphila yanglinensis]|uniref:TIGR02680 family protein n=1 Tax=Actinacidiphila yanglinensis TaxID=310779 RepID=A0A1H6DJ78_9ACTN|nr:TIGR02680 family protein [Actinacidiphila yanglinensis]SEG85264.1 TIGR02680 family protein [Actinacidiphila yanglinensis]SEG91068.1 TIGR02680 family protein [Actinacidiphila yanglinensis]